MNSKSKKTWILIGASIATLGLAAIAVVTSLRLSSMSDTAVAPTAPVSKPSAALINNGCSTPFSVSTSICNEWCNDNGDCGLDADQVVYECVITEGDTSGTCRNPEYPDSETCDSVVLAGCNETCLVEEDCGSGLTCDDQTDTCRDPEFLDSETCKDESLLDCNESCTEDVECDTEYCNPDSNTCRHSEFPDSVTCEDDSLLDCNESCAEDVECDTEYCNPDSNRCRHSEYPDSETCEKQEHLECVSLSCELVDGAGEDKCEDDTDCTTSSTPKPSSTPTPIPAATPTPEPTLPEAGNTIPTTTLLSIGMALLLFGAMSILAL